MRRILPVVVAVGALTGCGTSYQITRECYNENPVPASMQAGMILGPIGMGIAYLADGPAISDASQKRADCVREREAELAQKQ